jgi:hypothetical protein
MSNTGVEMRLRIVAFLISIATIMAATYMHESYHRYDLVTAAAGSGGGGGSQDVTGDKGEVKIIVYLIDHRTGRVWTHSDSNAGDISWTKPSPAMLFFSRFVPMERLSCADLGSVEVREGCREPNTSK